MVGLKRIYGCAVFRFFEVSNLSERIRSFIAFDMESPQVLIRMGQAQKLILETGADVKLVEPQNIHVTMRFLGDISSSTVDKI